VYNANDFRQIEVHIGEPLVPDLGHLEVEIDIANVKNINLQAVITFRQNCIKQEVKH
jgi:hypothetical protein